MKIATYLLIIAAAFAFSSCGNMKDITIEKRHYRNGYYVHVRDNKSTGGTTPTVQTIEEKTAPATTIAGEKNQPVVEKTAQPDLVSKSSDVSAEEKSTKKSSALSSSEKTTSILPGTIHPAIKHFPKLFPAKDGDDDTAAVALFLLIILAILLPPLAVLLKDGLGLPFLLDLILWLLGYGLVIFIAGTGFIYLGIFGLIAIIYALLIVLDVI